MTNPVTPNIGLNKIDRTSPSTTYFDLEKYIDQNADAIDRFAGQTSESIDALEKRLDTEERREVVLQPGLQIVNAERSAPFKLSGIKGRTLVNLLGRIGNCEDVSPWSDSGSIHALDNVNKTTGNNGFKITTTASSGNVGNIFFRINNIDKTKHYVLLADLKNGNATRIVLQKQNVGTGGSAPFMEVTDNTMFSTVAVKIQPAYFSSDDTIAVLVYGAQGQNGYADAIRLYEISEAEYAALNDMTPEQVAAKYPYVDSVQPVRNPYAIRYGENLLPSLMGAQLINTSSFSISPNEWYNPTGADAVAGYSYVQFSVTPNTPYTLSVDVASNIDHAVYPLDLNVPAPPKKWNSNPSFTFNSGNNTALNYLVRASVSGNPARLKKPMVTLGQEAKPFKPREDSMLALQTDLYADPLTGSNADEVFEKDGQYFKLAKWRKVVLNNSLPWQADYKADSYQTVTLSSNALPSGTTGLFPYTTKFDGSLLKTWVPNISEPDYAWLREGGSNLYVTISNVDSGWGPQYVPTADEIKAYFMGWKMYDGGTNPNGDGVYNRTDGLNKCWAKRTLSGTYFGGVAANVPKDTYSEFIRDFEFYQLIYQLATPMVEPIVSEGILTFNEGDNQVEVGTGIVVRESVKPAYMKNSDGKEYYQFNNTDPIVTSPFKNRVDRILEIFANSRSASGVVFKNESVAYGLQDAHIEGKDFDKNAAYSSTYLMLDRSPIVPLTGSYAANERAILQELTDAVQQNATAVSLLMNKKADKDIPGWITPTLTNGWVSYATDTMTYYGYPTAQYMKDSQEFIYLRGLVKGGTAPQSIIFYLPEGYRPRENITFVTICYVTSGIEQITRVKISPNGAVTYMVGPTLSGEASWLSLNLPPFTVE